MADIDAFVDYADHHASTSLRCIPRLLRANLCQSVQRIKLRIVGRRRVNMHDVVWFGIKNVIASLQSGDRFHRVVCSHARESQAIDDLGSFEAIHVHEHLFLRLSERGRLSL